jgi:hypothetical protein
MQKLDDEKHLTAVLYLQKIKKIIWRRGHTPITVNTEK